MYERIIINFEIFVLIYQQLLEVTISLKLKIGINQQIFVDKS